MRTLPVRDHLYQCGAGHTHFHIAANGNLHEIAVDLDNLDRFKKALKCGIINSMNIQDKTNAPKFEHTTLGSRVRGLRKTLKISQKEFCKKLNISNTNLSKIENDKTLPGHDFFYNILRQFDASLNYLLGGEGPMFLDHDSAAKFGNNVPTEFIEEFLYRFLHSRYLQYLVMAKYIAVMESKDDRRIIADELKRIKK